MVRKAAAQVSSSLPVSDASCWCLSNSLTTVIETQTWMVCLVLPFLQPWLESVLSVILQQNDTYLTGTTCATYTCVTPKTRSTIRNGKRRNVIFHVSWTVFEIGKKERQLVVAPLVQVPNGAFRVNLSQELQMKILSNLSFCKFQFSQGRQNLT